VNPVLQARLAKRARDAVHTRIHVHGETTTFERIQDCTPIVEHAQALHKEGFHGSTEMRHAASLPLVIIEKYCNEQNIDLREFMCNPDHIRRVVNNPDNSMFRIWPGRI
jgi:hypothetical protein